MSLNAVTDLASQDVEPRLGDYDDITSNVSTLTPQPVASFTHTPQSKDQKRLSHLLAVMPAGVVVIDHKGTVTLANNQAESLLEEPLIGELWRHVIQRVFTPKADDGHEVSMRNGKRVKIDTSPLTEERGQLIVITDLTQTRALQNRVSHMQRLSSLGKMVASLAHQVRTPLSSALLYAENLKTVSQQTPLATKFSQRIITHLHDLETQVNDMLLFAKSGEKQIVNPINIGKIVELSVEHVEAHYQQHDVTLVVDDECSDITVVANTAAVIGAIGNLLHNALQVSIEASQTLVTLQITKRVLNALPYVEIKVSDTAYGIGNSSPAQLFEPFYTTKPQGTGLGLAVVNTVAKSHNGFVNCGNNKEIGAWFSMYLPFEMPQDDQNVSGVSA